MWPSPAPLVLDVRKSTLPLLYEPLRVIEESSYNDEDDRVIPINWEFLHVALGSRQLSSLCCSPGQWVQFAGLKILVHPDFKDVQPKHSCWLSLETFMQPFHSIKKLRIKSSNIHTTMQGTRFTNQPGKAFICCTSHK